KLASPISEPEADRVVTVIDYRQVQLPVAIEVRRHHRLRFLAHLETALGKSAAPASQQDAQAIPARSRHRQVLIAVAIEVTHRDGVGCSANAIVCLGVERTSAFAQDYAHGVASEVCHYQVSNPVFVEVSGGHGLRVQSGDES